MTIPRASPAPAPGMLTPQDMEALLVKIRTEGLPGMPPEGRAAEVLPGAVVSQAAGPVFPASPKHASAQELLLRLLNADSINASLQAKVDAAQRALDAALLEQKELSVHPHAVWDELRALLGVGEEK